MQMWGGDGPHATVPCKQTHSEGHKRSLPDACVNTHTELRKSFTSQSIVQWGGRLHFCLHGGGRRGRRMGGGVLLLTPPPFPLRVKEKKKNLNSPFPFPWIILRETPALRHLLRHQQRSASPRPRPVTVVPPPPLSPPSPPPPVVHPTIVNSLLFVLARRSGATVHVPYTFPGFSFPNQSASLLHPSRASKRRVAAAAGRAAAPAAIEQHISFCLCTPQAAGCGFRGFASSLAAGLALSLS